MGEGSVPQVTRDGEPGSAGVPPTVPIAPCPLSCSAQPRAQVGTPREELYAPIKSHSPTRSARVYSKSKNSPGCLHVLVSPSLPCAGPLPQLSFHPNFLSNSDPAIHRHTRDEHTLQR